MQVTVDAERAGAVQLNLAVDDLATTKDGVHYQPIVGSGWGGAG